VTFDRRLGAAAVLAAACFLAGAVSPEPPGARLARRLGCFACHSPERPQGAVAGRLNGLGERLSPAELQSVLLYPRSLHPGAKMPSYAYLPPDELQSLLEFLQSLRGAPGDQ
jgi:mono/diheme cytochrome c family protein